MEEMNLDLLGIWILAGALAIIFVVSMVLLLRYAL